MEEKAQQWIEDLYAGSDALLHASTILSSDELLVQAEQMRYFAMGAEAMFIRGDIDKTVD